MRILISIITPSLGRISYLKKNINQIKNIRRKFKNFEWIIVVEKKDLNTINFLKKFRYKYIKVFIGKYDSAENAFNAGLRKSKGEYVNFHGNDDFFNIKNKQHLNKKIFLENYKWIIFDGEYIDDKFLIKRKLITHIKSFLLKKFGLVDLSVVNFIMTPSVFVKRQICKKLGGLGKIKQPGSDYILWMRFNKRYKPKVYPIKLTYSMITNKTITGKFDMNKYVFIFKKMIKNNKYGLIGRFFILLSITIIIIYNFINKKLINGIKY
tara:strand:- start:2984 stop:3781 length:798 start_codon:yes stop_codon:yes gene_type:complete